MTSGVSPQRTLKRKTKRRRISSVKRWKRVGRSPGKGGEPEEDSPDEDDGEEGDDGSDDSEGMASRLDRILEDPPQTGVDVSQTGVPKGAPSGPHESQ